jgi:hypothetical protein
MARKRSKRIFLCMRRKRLYKRQTKGLKQMMSQEDMESTLSAFLKYK